MDELDLGATIRSFTNDQKVFGRYTLIKTIGRGGMGIVWLAHDDKLERDVALKFLPEIVAQDARAIEDLKRETRRSLVLTHPNIVRIYDFLDDARAAAISMEYVAGDNLSKRSAEQPNHIFPLAELRPWVRQLCDALTYAHTKAKIVHLDLKPANLMLDVAGDLKVADFGIAANISDSVSRVTQRAGSSGTPVYMSPQQMMGVPPAVTDDIYALGATLYELLTGRPPFHSGNIFMQVSDKVAPPVNECRRANSPEAEPVPPAWEATIAACLAKKAEDRPQSAGEVWERLNRGTAAGKLTAKVLFNTRETAVKSQEVVPPPTPARPQTEVPGARSRTPSFAPLKAPPEVDEVKDRRADGLTSSTEPQAGARSTSPVSTDAAGSSLLVKNQAKTVTSAVREVEDAEPPPAGRTPGGRVSRRGIVMMAGVVAALVLVALLVFARYGDPIPRPDRAYRPEAVHADTNIKPEFPKGKEPALNAKAASPEVDVTLATREQLQALGIYVRALTPEEKESHGRHQGVFITIPLRVRAMESNYEVADARLEGSAVLDVIQNALDAGLIGAGQSKLETVAKALASSYESYQATTPSDKATGVLLAEYLDWLADNKNRVDSKIVLDYLHALRTTLKKIELLGLTKPEIEGSKAQIYGSFLRARLNIEPEFLRGLIESSQLRRL